MIRLQHLAAQGAGHLALCLLLVFFTASLLAGCLPEQMNRMSSGDASCAAEEASEEFFAMDTKMTVKVYGEGAPEAAREAKERLLALDALWSATREGSDVARLNGGAGEAIALSPKTMRLLRMSEEVREETKGALDVTLAPLLQLWGFTGGVHRVPTAEEIEAARALTGAGKLKLDEAAGTARLEKGSSVELGAVAKGYAGELVAAELKSRGVRSAILDLGGNIEVIGAREGGAPWRIGLRNPFGGALLGTVAVADAAVVTSAIDQRFFTDEAGNRYWHILDPATGKPAASGLASATVVASSGGRADALSTALFVMGAERAAAFWRERQDFEMVLVGMDGHVWITEGLLDRFSAGEGLTGEVEVIR
ncbi:FAD:protein FMN transferase [uncultured Selenomonas sp.]|uniref:FAD:protein FMN transferase n=1 Tax=uncultured Selenomonas sp. TaxID=159275 RepID=UPI002618B57C|nr:FAD:protein FMN transferase [uncultured Selenomonas sp.]